MVTKKKVIRILERSVTEKRKLTGNKIRLKSRKSFPGERENQNRKDEI